MLRKSDLVYYIDTFPAIMALSKEKIEVPVLVRKQIDILDFSPDLGDLSPIECFKGPKMPSPLIKRV